MTRYKWCVCDMDGTLLNSQSAISEENEAALKRLQEKGIEVIIASGRTDLMVKSYIKQLGLTGPVISSNGGLIRNIKTGEILYLKLIEKSVVKEVLDFCSENNIDFLIYTIDRVYGNKGNPLMLKYGKLNKNLPESINVPLEYLHNVNETIDNIDVLKILLVCGDHERIIELEEYFSKNEKITAVSSAKGLLDIMAPNISKGNALKILAEKMDVDLNDVIAFGDNYNDAEMLKSVGMPIAVENAVEDIKLQAKYITKSNNESGIAHAINNFILAKN
ncbi:Cof-type HAD-IIB family hydrolase [Clostridium sp. OS1-26]|uniref:Cof-type HAD-IIB family hydrolase n=1 Tax=Clostridium sp. OS1-26 TaxID=3070681 RepID=UPI0027E1D65E|nr:Cof-type HAD-IIB family hydrolase [Clostridium sp. OS1-26]WML33277.1 Cof-type HAD-IIB family hydrolase [Clostridium sp. OS1-26]